MTSKATRRDFCQSMAAGAGWEIAGIGGTSLPNPTSASESHFHHGAPAEIDAAEGDLLTNPRYAMGSKFRLAQFIQKGGPSGS